MPPVYGARRHANLSRPPLAAGRARGDYSRSFAAPSGAAFYNRAALAAYFQDNNDDGRADRGFAQTIQTIFEFFEDAGRAPERAYFTNGTDPRWWNDGTPIPAELEMPGFAILAADGAPVAVGEAQAPSMTVDLETNCDDTVLRGALRQDNAIARWRIAQGTGALTPLGTTAVGDARAAPASLPAR